MIPPLPDGILKVTSATNSALKHVAEQVIRLPYVTCPFFLLWTMSKSPVGCFFFLIYETDFKGCAKKGMFSSPFPRDMNVLNLNGCPSSSVSVVRSCENVASLPLLHGAGGGHGGSDVDLRPGGREELPRRHQHAAHGLGQRAQVSFAFFARALQCSGIVCSNFIPDQTAVTAIRV